MPLNERAQRNAGTSGLTADDYDRMANWYEIFGDVYAAEAKTDPMTEFARRARLAGKETVHGRDAFLLRAENLSDVELEQPAGDARFTLTSMSLWIDAVEYVSLRMNIDGEVDPNGSR